MPIDYYEIQVFEKLKTTVVQFCDKVSLIQTTVVGTVLISLQTLVCSFKFGFTMFHTLQAKSKSELHIRLFGAVGQWELINANYIARLLKDAKADGYEEVKFLLHCPGGSIFEGVAVNSVMKASGLIINIEVHGFACSWGAVMLQSADHRAMIEGTRLMIHQGNGGVSGSAAQIINYGNLLVTLNDDIANILADRTGKDKDWILENWMAEGKDKWFTATEAKKAGLIDEVLPNTKQKDKAAAYTSMEDLAAFFDQTLLETKTRKMNKEQLAKLGLDENATEEQITAALEALVKNQKEATAADSGAAHQQDNENPAATAIVMKAAENQGFLNEGNKESFAKLAKLDPAAAMDLLPGKAKKDDAHASVADLIKQIKAGSSQTTASAAKEWKDYSPEDLAKMEEEKLEEFKALFEKTFNKKLK